MSDNNAESDTVRIECPNCGMPYDVPAGVGRWSCDCGESWDAKAADGGRSESATDRMNQYRDLQSVARNIRHNALRVDDVVDNVMWIAAGGRGTGHLGELEELAEALEEDAAHLREQIDEADDPREVRSNA